MRSRSFLFAVLAAAMLIWAGIKVKHWLDIDACLDAGGAFDYAQGSCDDASPENPKNHLEQHKS